MLKKAIFILFFLSSFAYSMQCNKKINIASKENTPLYEILHQISNTCKATMVVEDSLTLSKLKKPYKTLYLQNGSLDEAVKTLIGDDFFYSLDEKKLNISYLGTKIFKLNYVSLQRNTKSSTKLTLDSGSTNFDSSASSTENEGIMVNISNKFDFWKDIKEDINSILDQYESSNRVQQKNVKHDYTLVINEKTGSLYVRGSKKQLLEVQEYIKHIKNNISKQVLVDVNIYQVKLSNGRKTGIDWSQLQDLQNINAKIDLNLGSTALSPDSAPSTVTLGKAISIDNILSFINRYGKTDSVSNPRVLAINNQTAVISIGQQIYYKIVQSSTLNTGSSSTQSNSEQISSIFSGLVVDITPSISKDNKLILKINVSITELTNSSKNQTSQASFRVIPPDLDKKEVSTVVSSRDGQKIVLGGLISNSKLDGNTGVRWLSSIPWLGYFFGADVVNESKEELVIVITPKILSIND